MYLRLWARHSFYGSARDRRLASLSSSSAGLPFTGFFYSRAAIGRWSELFRRRCCLTSQMREREHRKKAAKTAAPGQRYRCVPCGFFFPCRHFLSSSRAARINQKKRHPGSSLWMSLSHKKKRKSALHILLALFFHILHVFFFSSFMACRRYRRQNFAVPPISGCTPSISPFLSLLATPSAHKGKNATNKKEKGKQRGRSLRVRPILFPPSASFSFFLYQTDTLPSGRMRPIAHRWVA